MLKYLKIILLVFGTNTLLPGVVRGETVRRDQLRVALDAAKPAAWSALLDQAEITQLEALLEASLRPQADDRRKGAKADWWHLAALRTIRLLAHVGRRGAALRWAEVALGEPGVDKEAINRLISTLQPPKRAMAIGVLGPMTGPYGAAGKSILKAARMAAEGSGVKLHIFDTQGDMARAAAGVRTLVRQHGVSLVVGPVGQKESLAAAVEAERQEVPIITLTRREGITQTGTFVFRHRLTTRRASDGIIRFATETLGVKELAILRPDSAYGKEALHAVWGAAQSHGATVVGAQKYSPNARRFDTAIKGLIGRAVLEDRPPDPHWESLNRKSKDPALHVAPVVDFDAIYVADSGRRLRLLLPFLSYWDIELRSLTAEDAAELAHKYAGEPPRQVYVLGGPGFRASGFERLPIKEAVNAYFCDVYWSDTKLGRLFDGHWKATFSRAPSTMAAHAYAAAQRGVEAIKRAVPDGDLRLELKRGHESIFGPTTVDGRGEFIVPPRVLTISREGGIVLGGTPNSVHDEDAPP